MTEPTEEPAWHLQDWHVLLAIVAIAAIALTAGLLLDNGNSRPASNGTRATTTATTTTTQH